MVAGALSRLLRRFLSAVGRCIAFYPSIFLVIPTILTVSLAYCFVRSIPGKQNDNALELYVPKQGLSKTSREQIQALFGDTDDAEFDPINGVSFAIILKQRDGGDILNGPFITEYLWLRQQLEAIDVRYLGGRYRYAQMCRRNRLNPTSCMPDFVQLTTLRGVQGYRDIRLMHYPKTQWTAPGSSIPIELVVPLGGVNTSHSGLVRSARAVLMTFTFASEHYDAAQLWERQLNKALAQYRSQRVLLTHFTMGQFQKDLASMATYLHELMPSLLLVIVVFCILSCCVADWVHSKPFLAVGGVVSTLMAIASGFGLAVLLEVPTVDIVYVAPFLMLSVGVDDMFLMLAAWRRTSCFMSVDERMAHTFGDAAVSITITSVTDALSFAIGAFTVFPAVRYFCIYTAISLIFTYLYQTTLFGAVMVLTGRREAANRHCFFMIKLKTSLEIEEDEDAQSQQRTSSMCYKVFCTGGDGRIYDSEIYGVASTIDGTMTAHRVNVNDKKHKMKTKSGCLPIKPNDNIFNLFFQRYYAPLLQHKSVKFIAAASYILYLCMAVYGATTVRIGMNYAELLPDGSITSAYLMDFGQHFAHSLSAPLEVLMPSTDLSLPSEQERVLSIVAAFEHTLYTGTADYFLRDFAGFYQVNHGNRDSFYLLLNEFIQLPTYNKYASQVKFDPLHRVVHSRCLVETHSISFGQERIFLSAVKDVLAIPGLMENVTAYHSTFQLAEQQASVLPAMISTVAAATVAMLLVAFLLIPKPACSLCLAACIISTNLGVLGAMSLWGVRVDIISMITVLMSVGISVDFVAHVSYFYVQALQMDLPLSKAQRALRYLGLPIMQGALSTSECGFEVCGMLVLLAIRAYMVRAFVKTLLLVIVFGLYHGLLLLPIVLSLFIKENNRSVKFHVPPSTVKPTTPNSGAVAVESVFDETIKRPNKMQLERQRKHAQRSLPPEPAHGSTPATSSTNTDSSSTEGRAKPTDRSGQKSSTRSVKHNLRTTNYTSHTSSTTSPLKTTTANKSSSADESNWRLAKKIMPTAKSSPTIAPIPPKRTISSFPTAERAKSELRLEEKLENYQELPKSTTVSRRSDATTAISPIDSSSNSQQPLQQAPPIRQITRNAKVLHWLSAHPKKEQSAVYSSTKLDV